MKELHPGGLRMTKELLYEAHLFPCRILDMGCGSGHSIAYLHQLGYDAWGIDKEPADQSDPRICRGDFLHTSFPDAAFDAVISECAFFISGDVTGAICEARRLLKDHGILLLADVCMDEEAIYFNRLKQSGFQVLFFKDITQEWKEYYVSCIWDGTAERLYPHFKKGVYHYYLTVCERM